LELALTAGDAWTPIGYLSTMRSLCRPLSPGTAVYGRLVERLRVWNLAFNRRCSAALVPTIRRHRYMELLFASLISRRRLVTTSDAAEDVDQDGL